MIVEGLAQALDPKLQDPVEYTWQIGDTVLELNSLLGKHLSITHTGRIQCSYCARVISKSFNGYCYLCTQRLARCDLCIVKPELCHYHLGTCREPAWGEAHCLQAHVVYLANTSGLKVGITRSKNIPRRWLDQGAHQAIPLLAVKQRLDSGLIEIELAQSMSDKTNWRKMLSGSARSLDMEQQRAQALDKLGVLLEHSGIDYEPLTEPAIEIEYPVIAYPHVTRSLNLMKTPTIDGRLMGIKGQYLLLDVGVLNIRNCKNFQLRLEVKT